MPKNCLSNYPNIQTQITLVGVPNGRDVLVDPFFDYPDIGSWDLIWHLDFVIWIFSLRTKHPPPCPT